MSIQQSSNDLTSGHLLAKNTGWNIIGQLLPMLVGVVCIPPLVGVLGIERFGLLSLAWIIIGYLSLFDLGLGRSLTKLVADKIGSGEEQLIPSLVWTSLLLLLLLGLFGGLTMLGLSRLVVYKALNVPQTLQSETLRSIRVLAVSIPLITVTSGLRGVLEALQQFRLLNWIRIPTSIFSFAGPLLVLPFSRSLVPIVVVLAFGRLLGAIAHLLACFYAVPRLRKISALQPGVVLPLMKFGTWMTVTNIVGPLMLYADRFIIGSQLSVSAVAFYTTPFDVLGRLTLIPSAITGVLFPAFATTLAGNPGRTALLASRGIKYIFLIMFPIVLVAVAFAPEALRLWLGPVFASQSESVLRWLAAGVLVNSIACIPFSLLQSAGRPRQTATLHLLELPLYLITVWVLTLKWGILGASIAWTSRMILDALLLFFLAHRALPYRHGFLLKLAGGLLAGLLALGAATMAQTLLVKSMFCLCVSLILVIISVTGMTSDERHFLRRLGKGRGFKVQGSGV